MIPVLYEQDVKAGMKGERINRREKRKQPKSKEGLLRCLKFLMNDQSALIFLSLTGLVLAIVFHTEKGSPGTAEIVCLAVFFICPFLIGRISILDRAFSWLQRKLGENQKETDRPAVQNAEETKAEREPAPVSPEPADPLFCIRLSEKETVELRLPPGVRLEELIRRWEAVCPMKETGERWVLMASRRGADDAVLAVVTREAEGRYTVSRKDCNLPFGHSLTACRIGPGEDRPGMLRHGAVSWPPGEEMPYEGVTVTYFDHTISCSVAHHFEICGTGSRTGWAHDGNSRSWQDSEFSSGQEALAAIDQMLYDSAPYRGMYSRKEIMRALAEGFDVPYEIEGAEKP